MPVATPGSGEAPAHGGSISYVDDFLSGWLACWSVARESPVQIELRVGTPWGLNPSAWLGAESAYALGGFTVWADGSIEVEVMRIPQEVRFHVVSGVVTGPDELASRLSAFVHACETRVREG